MTCTVFALTLYVLGGAAFYCAVEDCQARLKGWHLVLLAWWPAIMLAVIAVSAWRKAMLGLRR